MGMTLAEWIAHSQRTRSDVARELQISPPYMTRLARREQAPSLSLAVRIIELSGGRVTLAELAAVDPDAKREGEDAAGEAA